MKLRDLADLLATAFAGEPDPEIRFEHALDALREAYAKGRRAERRKLAAVLGVPCDTATAPPGETHYTLRQTPAGWETTTTRTPTPAADVPALAHVPPSYMLYSALECNDACAAAEESRRRFRGNTSDDGLHTADCPVRRDYEADE